MRPLPGSRAPAGEPPYLPGEWNNSSGLTTHNCYSYAINDLHHGPRRFGKPQPSWYRKLVRAARVKGPHPRRELSCVDMEKGVKEDNPDTIKFLSLQKGEHYIPPPNHYKAFLMVSPGNDFHFARQDNRMLSVYKHLKLNDLKLPKTKFIAKVLRLSEKYNPVIYSMIPPSAKTPVSKLRFLYRYSKTWSHKPGAAKVTDRDASGNLIFNPLKANWDFDSINYSHPCKFFTVPMNTHAETHSTGNPGPFNFNPNVPPKGLTRLDISATEKQQLFDQKVRRSLLRPQSRS
jgi:hypothetical protein